MLKLFPNDASIPVAALKSIYPKYQKVKIPSAIICVFLIIPLPLTASIITGNPDPVFSEYIIFLLSAVALLIVQTGIIGLLIWNIMRRQHETAARQSIEQKYQEMVKNSKEGIFRSTLDGRIITANQALAGIFGFKTAEELISSVRDLRNQFYVNHDGMDSFFSRIVKEGSVSGFEMMFYRKDRQKIWLLMSGHLVINPDGSTVVEAFLTDISDRKKAELSLEENEALLRTLVQTIPDLVWLKDADGVYLFCNQRFEDLYGASESEIRGKTDYHFVSRELADFFREKDRNAVNSGRPFLNEEWLTFARNGYTGLFDTIKTPMFDSSGNLVGVLGIARDVTERKKSENALNEGSLFLTSLLNAIPLPVFYKDINGIYLGVNRAFEEFFGTSRAEIVGKSVYDIAPKELADRYHEKDMEVFHGAGVQVYESQVVGSDKVVHDVVFNKSQFFDSDGKMAGLIGVILDVTDAKKTEKERKNLEEQLFQSQKMEAVGQLAGGVAHDYNNVLSAISGFCYLQKMDLEQRRINTEYLDQIMEATDRAAGLTKSLLTFSRKQQIDPKEIDLNEIIRNSEKIISMILGENIRLALDLAEANTTVKADSNQMGQILMNLAANSRDAMPGGGVFTIATSKIFMDEDFIKMHGYGLRGDYIVMTVSDNGIGMDETVKKRLFEPFFSTKEVGKGTGLGLSIIYGIVKQHRGYIHVYSEPLKGTSIKIFIPSLESLAASVKQSAVFEPKRASETILLVEDDRVLRAAMCSMLEKFGFVIIEAVDGKDAVEKFIANMDDIDLVLMDVIMPNKNGHDASLEMKKIKPGVKVILTSGYTGEHLVSALKGEHGIYFIEKPASPQTIYEKIISVLHDGESHSI